MGWLNDEPTRMIKILFASNALKIHDLVQHNENITDLRMDLSTEGRTEDHTLLQNQGRQCSIELLDFFLIFQLIIQNYLDESIANIANIVNEKYN